MAPKVLSFGTPTDSHSQKKKTHTAIRRGEGERDRAAKLLFWGHLQLQSSFRATFVLVSLIERDYTSIRIRLIYEVPQSHRRSYLFALFSQICDITHGLSAVTLLAGVNTLVKINGNTLLLLGPLIRAH